MIATKPPTECHGSADYHMATYTPTDEPRHRDAAGRIWPMSFAGAWLHAPRPGLPILSSPIPVGPVWGRCKPFYSAAHPSP